MSDVAALHGDSIGTRATADEPDGRMALRVPHLLHRCSTELTLWILCLVWLRQGARDAAAGQPGDTSPRPMAKQR